MIHSTPPLHRSFSLPSPAALPAEFHDDTWVGTPRAEQPTRGAKPPLLLLAPGAFNPQQVRQRVQAGAPSAEAHAMAKITGGVVLTAPGLEALYRQAVPELQWQVEDLAALPTAVTFRLTATVPRRRWYALRARPKPVYHCEKELRRHANAALELHAFAMFLHESLRGRGLVARCETVETQLLRSLSAHPDTRLSLAAGHSRNPFKLRRPIERGGFYVHGAHHYLLAEAEEVPFPAHMYDRQPCIDNRLRLCNLSHSWFIQAHERGTLRDGRGQPLTEGTRIDLHARIDACRTPHDFAMLRAPGVTVAGQRGLGKAFLTSDAAPWWPGVRFVNPPAVGSPHAPQRQQSARGFAARALIEMPAVQLKLAKTRT